MKKLLLVTAGVGIVLGRMGMLYAGGLAEGGIEDKRARELLEKGKLHYDVREYPEALEIYKNVIDRFPKSKYRWAAYLLLGQHWFAKKDYEKAVGYLHKCSEGSLDADEVAESLYLIGCSYYEQKDYPKCFSVLRRVTANYPGTDFCNKAYYYIGMGHFNLKHYKRAIESFRMVGTSIKEGDPNVLKLAPGKRLFVKVNDKDLSVASRQKKKIPVEVTANKTGDKETVELESRGITGVDFIGSVKTELGDKNPGNGILEVVGNDTVTITYTDKHAADKKRDVPRSHSIEMADDGKIDFVDGIFKNRVQGVALDRDANIRLLDADLDVSTDQQTIDVIIRCKREIEEDLAAKAAKKKLLDEGKEVEEKKYEIRDELKKKLHEQKSEEGDGPCHSYVFTGRVPVKEGEPDKSDQIIQAEMNDVIEVEYVDARRLKEEKPVVLKSEVVVVKGDLSIPVPYDSKIRSETLRVKAELQVASALMHMGRIYKELGLKSQADDKFGEALKACGKVIREASYNKDMLEQCQYLLWQIYFQKEDLDRAAAVCMNLIKNFPFSEFADDALMMMGQVAQKKAEEGDVSRGGQQGYSRAIGFYKRLLTVSIEKDEKGNITKHGPLAPDAQYYIAECYEAMGKTNTANLETALKEYQKCSEDFPLSKFAPKAITKIANFYYQMKDYNRALEIYEKTLRDYPDAEFVDMIILNYGKCLVMMKEYRKALEKFEQLVNDHPTSSHVRKAQKYAKYVKKKIARMSRSDG